MTWGWVTTALDWGANALESEAFNAAASAAASAASTYLLAQMMGGDDSTPSLSDLGTQTPADINPGTVADATQKAEDDARARRGHDATILTGPQGLLDDESVIARNTLLGG